jgi:ABC-type multidrug transport system fused ATPase/permease subunit
LWRLSQLSDELGGTLYVLATDGVSREELWPLLRHAFTQFVKGRTAIFIKHRPSTLALADRVAVIEHGPLIDVGTPDKLEGRCDLVRPLCCVGLRESA